MRELVWVSKMLMQSAVPLFRSYCRDRVSVLIYCTCTSMAQETANGSSIESIAQVHYEDFFLSLSYPSVSVFKQALSNVVWTGKALRAAGEDLSLS